MIYEINNKPYIKIQNFYSEVEVLNDRMVPKKEFKKIYDDEVNESEIKKYNSLKEYNQRQITREEIGKEIEPRRRNRLSKIK